MKKRMPVKFNVGDIVSKKFNAFREKLFILILAVKEDAYFDHKPSYIFLVLDSNTPYYKVGEQRKEPCEWLDRSFQREA